MYTIAAFLCLFVASVAGYSYQTVSKCPNVAGDPVFGTTQIKGTRGIYATSSAADAATDRCVTLSKGTFYVTGKDNSLKALTFKENADMAKGTFTTVGPDGNTYRVTALKSYGSECGNMNLLLRCSDSIGKANVAPQVKIHANIDEKLSDACLNDAAAYAEKVLGQKITLYKLDSTNCKSG